MRETAPTHSFATPRAGGTQQSPESLHRSLATRPKAVCESATPGLAALSAAECTDAHVGRLHNATGLTLGRDARSRPNPLPTARIGGMQQSPKSLDRSLAIRSKAV
eukprot:7192613-Prymnesium_polylepis.1